MVRDLLASDQNKHTRTISALMVYYFITKKTQKLMSIKLFSKMYRDIEMAMLFHTQFCFLVISRVWPEEGCQNDVGMGLLV